MDHMIYVKSETLTDGSVVWNILIGNLELPAADEANAMAFANIIANAICDHTLHLADVVTHAP